MDFIDVALEQIKWERYRRGYANEGDLVSLKSRLRDARDNGGKIGLSKDDKAVLRKATQGSIGHILNYDYGLDNAERLRDEALAPLYQFMNQLNQEDPNESQS